MVEPKFGPAMSGRSHGTKSCRTIYCLYSFLVDEIHPQGKCISLSKMELHILTFAMLYEMLPLVRVNAVVNHLEIRYVFEH